LKGKAVEGLYLSSRTLSVFNDQQLFGAGLGGFLTISLKKSILIISSWKL
jgi:hypothetical protein